MVKLRRTAAKAMTPELRKQAERLLALSYDHMAAIRGEDAAFYTDGRHDELGELAPVVHRALGVKPWDDDVALLEAALGDDAG